MTFKEFTQYLSDITYKDYSHFVCVKKGIDMFQIALVSYRPDVTKRIYKDGMNINYLPSQRQMSYSEGISFTVVKEESLIKLHFEQVITSSFFETKELANMCLSRLVKDFECHESEEWLRYNGKPIKNPHPEILKD